MLYTAFNFRVDLLLTGGEGPGGPLCSAAFAECDGLEMTMEAKTIREGGNPTEQIHLYGPITYGQLALKRGMTSSFDLWTWFSRTTEPDQHHLRASGVVTMLAADGATEVVRFKLTRCLPVRLKAPALNARDGDLAIEEMQIAYERLEVEPIH